ncbi:MAG: amidohydrolase [Candidatus Heimdallarchaeota archaeon]|nr:amidohydrolase [Candidatus Heimdallarchaeota archaeon]MDH5644499.1 amidohydrolase [Candidatus Heimdallarchaeota archaeon]
MKTAFTNATIHTSVDGEILENGTLIIDNGKIVEIGRNISTEGCEVIDCSSNVITPGFIDAHSHVGLWEEGARDFTSNDGNEYSDIITPYLRSMDSIFPEDKGFENARMGGVTTMGISHGSANAIGGQLCVVKSYGIDVDKMVIREPAGVKMAMGENPKGVGVNHKKAPQTRMGVAYIIRKSFYEAIDYRRDWEEYNDKIVQNEKKEEADRKYVKPPKKDMGKEVLLKLLDKEIPARCHSHRADDIKTAIRLSEEFGFNLVIDHATESYKIKEVIKEKGLTIVNGPLFGVPTKRETKYKTMKTPGIMVKAGVKVCVTTDAPVVPIEGLRDTLIMAIREGLPQDQALATVTINPAEVLGVEDRVGSLQVGKDADFLIFNGDPFDTRTQVVSTYIDGLLVYQLS